MTPRERIEANSAKITTREQADAAFAFFTGSIRGALTNRPHEIDAKWIVDAHTVATCFGVAMHPAKEKEAGNE